MFESVAQLTELAPGRQSFKAYNKDVEVRRPPRPPSAGGFAPLTPGRRCGPVRLPVP